ncbi:hypothetical protein AB0D32_23895 [Micromonospora sp. NPDC048170]|uniref:hypothetical protein n=1 Tax=Micromonospora sp. NPDC048170 TaxID=3154819 RepID=UPI0034039E3D
MTRSRAQHPPAKWPLLNSRAVSTRPPGTNLSHPPPVTTWHTDQWRPYALLEGITLLTSALALLVVALSM